MKFLQFKKFWLATLWYLALIAYFLVIAFFSLWEFTGPPSTIPHLDKIQHFIAYSLLGFSLSQVCAKGINLRVILTAFGYSFLMECLQGLTSYRMFEYYDLLVNFLGASFGVLCTHYFAPNLLTAIDLKLKKYLTFKSS